ncbi:MAG: C40 family peptidase [Mycobacteriales bacterium]
MRLHALRYRLPAISIACLSLLGLAGSLTGTAAAAERLPTRAAAGPTRHIAYGHWTVIGAHLSTSGGRAVPGATLYVQGDIGGHWLTVGRVRTNAAGNAAASLRPGYSTYWSFVFPATGSFTATRSNSVPVYVSGPSPNAIAVAAAAAERGRPYRWGAAGPYAFDCSGLAEFAWARAGVRLPHNALLQYEFTRHIALSQVQPGDLVFTAGDGYSVDPYLIDHVGVYAGRGYWWVAPRPGTVVQLQHIYTDHLWASQP